MGRRYLSADYAAVVGRVRDAIPGVAIHGDVIVGFPTEDDVAWRRSLAFIRSIDFAGLHVFRYSARPGTPAIRMAGQVDEPTKKRRAAAAPCGRRGRAGALGGEPRRRRGRRAVRGAVGRRAVGRPRDGSHARGRPARRRPGRSRTGSAGSTSSPSTAHRPTASSDASSPSPSRRSPRQHLGDADGR